MRVNWPRIVLCKTKSQRKELTQALREIGCLPRTGRLIVDITGNSVVEVYAYEWKFLTKAEEQGNRGEFKNTGDTP